MTTSTIHVHLKRVPEDVNNLIKKEQQRLAFFENNNINQEYVVYEMIREWGKFKNHAPMIADELNQLKEEIKLLREQNEDLIKRCA